MTIKQFIERAIEGGWKNERFGDLRFMERVGNVGIFLDPLAWKAVGKVSGWKKYAMITWYDEMGTKKERERWRGVESGVYAMHRMIDALAEGKTIDEFIATL